MSLLFPSAFAQTAAAADTASPYAAALQYAPFLLIVVVFYVLWIRPQSLKAKETRSMLAALRRGDRVVTAGGILGTVTKVKDGSNEVEIEIASNVRVTVMRETIGSKMTAATEVPAKA